MDSNSSHSLGYDIINSDTISTISTIITFICNHTNTINYTTHKYTCSNDYKKICIANNTNYKLYNVNKYISYITFLDMHKQMF